MIVNKIEYFSNEQRELLIDNQIQKGLFLIEEQNISEGNFLIFGTDEDIHEPIIPEPTELELLQQKIQQQDEIIEEILFEILPSFMEVQGGE